MRLACLMMVAVGCNNASKDDVADTDDTDVASDTDVVSDTDVMGDTDLADTDLATGDTLAPVLPNTSGSDYTVFFDGSSLNIYWIAASDETSATDSLQYRVSCQRDPAPEQVTMDWTTATSLPVEGSGRYWAAACSGQLGTHYAWVSVRDEAGNLTDYPVLSGEITPGGPK